MAVAASPLGVIDFAPGLEVRREVAPAAYWQYPSQEQADDYDSPVSRSWSQRLKAGDPETWKVALAAARAAFSAGGVDELRKKWPLLVQPHLACERLPTGSGAAAFRTAFKQAFCRGEVVRGPTGPPPEFRGADTFLDSYDVLLDAKRLADSGTTPTELALAAEACVRNERRDFRSEARERCLSLLVELDFARAKRLIEDPKIWFVTSTGHFELVAAVVKAVPPVDALRSVGLLPTAWKPERFSSHYPRDLLTAAGQAGHIRVTGGAATEALSLGRTPLAGAVVEFDHASGAAVLWFKGRRYAVPAQPNVGPGARLAAFLNAVAEREKLDARWLCLAEGYFAEFAVGTEAQLSAGLERKLLIRDGAVERVLLGE